MMNDLKIEGMGTIAGGEYGIIEIDGMAKGIGDLKAERLSVDGMFKSEGSLRVGVLKCDGMAKVHGDIQADTIEIDGMLTVSGGTKIGAAEIHCDGMIKLDGEISADRIDADGFISAREIVGDDIRIRSHARRWFSFFRPGHSHIALIEATIIELRGVVACTVNGKDVTIGRGCIIENLDCSGTLSIAPGARVRNITGTYTRPD